MEAEGSETSIADFESPRSQVMPPSYYGDGSQNIEDPSVSLNQWNVSFYSQLYTSWLNFLGSCQSAAVWYMHCSLLFSVWLCYILLSAWYCIYVPIILQAIWTTASHDPLSGAGEFGVVHNSHTKDYQCCFNWNLQLCLYNMFLRGWRFSFHSLPWTSSTKYLRLYVLLFSVWNESPWILIAPLSCVTMETSCSRTHTPILRREHTLQCLTTWWITCSPFISPIYFSLLFVIIVVLFDVLVVLLCFARCVQCTPASIHSLCNDKFTLLYVFWLIRAICCISTYHVIDVPWIKELLSVSENRVVQSVKRNACMKLPVLVNHINVIVLHT